MVDISRDARWGRIMEGAGEDPLLASSMARAWVEGFQGDELSEIHSIAACAKHFAGYGFAEAGRDYNTAEISLNTMYNVVLPPFKAASEAGVASFMNAFNEIGGIPATGSESLQRDVLKGQWGFKGFVVSDWGSIDEMVHHGYAEDQKEAAKFAMKAGSDMDMESYAYEKHLENLINEDAVDISLLDDAVRRILRVKFELGLFDDPYKYCNEELEKTALLTKENLEGARDAARKSIVLIKNENDLLPLSKEVNSIAVIGQLAGSKDVPLGSWRAQAIAHSAISLVEGIQNTVKANTRVKYAQGYTLTEGDRDFYHELNIVEGDKGGGAEAINLAKNSEVVVLALGEDCFQTGEGRSQMNISLKGNQEELLKALLKVNKNIIVTLMNGRPLAIPFVVENAPAILETWHLGSESGNAIADVLFGDYNPSGKLPVSFPYHVGQEPLYYNRKSTGRPNPSDQVFWSHYTDGPNEALLPFGYGLSYSKFELSNFAVAVKGNNEVKVTATLKNTSERPGKETVQLYIRDMAASLIQPIKRLVAFKQISLNGGETQTFSFSLSEKNLGFYHSDGTFYGENGKFKIMIGTNSRDLAVEQIEVKFKK